MAIGSYPIPMPPKEQINEEMQQSPAGKYSLYYDFHIAL